MPTAGSPRSDLRRENCALGVVSQLHGMAATCGKGVQIKFYTMEMEKRFLFFTYMLNSEVSLQGFPFFIFSPYCVLLRQGWRQI